MSRNSYILIASLLLLPFVSCKRNGSGEDVNPTLDKYPELVSACKDWKQGGGSSAVGAGICTNVMHVTTLKDVNTAGSLRYALSKATPRIIVFDVAGTIYLESPLKIKSNVTILGQSAPGDGICVAGYPLTVSGADNVIVRFMRFRLGDMNSTEDGDDAVSVYHSSNVIFDHCTFSWATDEVFSCYGNTNFTLQYSILSEALRNAGRIKDGTYVNHGYAGIWGGVNASFHHNLLAHNDSRNPRFDHSYVTVEMGKDYFGPIDFVNNVIYNWGINSSYGGEGLHEARRINMVANYYKPGPATKTKGSNVQKRIVDPTTSCGNCSEHGGVVIPGKFFLESNYMDGNAEVTANNWLGSTTSAEVVVAPVKHTDGLTQLSNIETAQNAYQTVLAKAGCSYRRDALDKRIIDDVTNGKAAHYGSKKYNSNLSRNGFIDTPMDATNDIEHDQYYYPELSPNGNRGLDTDGDGMPDKWETQYGLNPNNSEDAVEVSLVTGYTNIEVYYCHLVKDLY